MDPIRNIIKVRVNNQDYLYQYENAWDKEKQRSYSKHRTTVGKLVSGKVQLGRKFLANNPQYKDIEFKFEDHKLIALSDMPAVNDAGVNAVLSKALFRVSIDIKLSNLRLKGNLYIKEVPHVYHGSR